MYVHRNSLQYRLKR
ncbi:MAG: hypothetical protein ACLRI8_09545 [Agathobacter rectalis]